MENKKTGQQLPPTDVGDGGEAMEKTEDTPISDGPKKLKNPKMQMVCRSGTSQLRKANSH